MMQTKKPDWNQRIERAIDLAGRHPASAEVLVFYGRVLEFQKELYDSIASQPAPPPRPNSHSSTSLSAGLGNASWASQDPGSAFRARLDVDIALQRLPALLALVRKTGPARLAQEAAEIGRGVAERQLSMLRDFLSAADPDDSGSPSFFARVLFQPIAEYCAGAQAAPLAGFAGSFCPVCRARPQVAVLHPEGHGGKRSLVCSFCLTEWEFLRILCPICGEEDNPKLPRYATESVKAVRVEACDTCKCYLKSVDMTVDGLAVPLVDEIAALPLDLWAAEQGYRKISLNLMGF